MCRIWCGPSFALFWVAIAYHIWMMPSQIMLMCVEQASKQMFWVCGNPGARSYM